MTGLRGTLICVQTYNYETKDGVHKEGRLMNLMALEEVNESDGRGNATVGYPTEEVYVPTAFGMTDHELCSLVGKVIEIRKEKRIGERWEKIVSIAEVTNE